MKDHKKDVFVVPPFTSEAVCAELLPNVSIENIKTHQIGSFKKSYRNDIERIETEEYSTKTNFNIFINRNSIYDLLPEGLFHQTLGSKRVTSVGDAVIEHKRFKQEEKDARKFFAPIEQMLFRFRIYTELAETEALFDIQNGKLNNTFFKFWNIDQNLPAPEANRMLQLMPYCNFIKGNPDTTNIALSYILNKEVTISTVGRLNRTSLAQPRAVQDTRLGIDTVLGSDVEEVLLYWIFTIGNLAKKDIADYAVSNKMSKLLSRFTEIFIPLEIDVEFELSGQPQGAEEMGEDILGYASHL